MLEPGESTVFAERLNDRLFRNWWGTNSLPPNFKFFSYSGIGLGAFGDTLYLWNAAALDPRDTVAILRWGGVLAGISMECEHACDPEGFGCEDEATTDSVIGIRGAFRAADSGDIGSPGYTSNPPVRILSFSRNGNGDAKLLCRTTPGKSYRMRRSPSLTPGSWMPLPSQMATNNILELTDQLAQALVNFYRVEEIQ